MAAAFNTCKFKVMHIGTTNPCNEFTMDTLLVPHEVMIETVTEEMIWVLPLTMNLKFKQNCFKCEYSH